MPRQRKGQKPASKRKNAAKADHALHRQAEQAHSQAHSVHEQIATTHKKVDQLKREMRSRTRQPQASPRAVLRISPISRGA